MSVALTAAAPAWPILPLGWRMTPRLAGALLASALLHAVALGLFGPGRDAAAPAPSARPLQVTFATLPAPPAATMAAMAPPPEPSSALLPLPGAPSHVAARFAEPPAFGMSENLPLLQPLRLRLRIHVSTEGRPQRIDVLEADNVPPQYLATIRDELVRSRYAPARLGEQPVAGAFDLELKAEPAGD